MDFTSSGPLSSSPFRSFGTRSIHRTLRIVTLSIVILYFLFDVTIDRKFILSLYGSRNDNSNNDDDDTFSPSSSTKFIKLSQTDKNYNRDRRYFRSTSSTSRGQSFCDTVSADDMAQAVRSSVNERTLYDGWGGAPYTLSSLAHVHPCIRRIDTPWYIKDVLFIVMASSLHVSRTKAVIETWGKSLSSNLLILGDADIPEINMVTLPDLEGQPSKADAPHRTLKGLQYVVHHRHLYGQYAWIFMVDDDTWVNIYELPSLLYGWDVRAPFMLSFIWNNPIFASERPRTWPSGGAGMLVTRAAAEIFAKKLYTDVCPFDMENDRTIGHCAWQTGVALVHTPLFDPESLHARQDAAYYNAYGNDGDIRTMITMHRADPEFMREWQTIVERYPMDNRLALQENEEV